MLSRDLPKLVNIKTAEIPNGMIINGVQQTMEAFVLSCPDCNFILNKFPNYSYLDVCNVCNVNLNNLPKYCPECGQRLRYNREKVEMVEKTDAKI